MAECTAAANIKGEHVPCDIPAPHGGWAHSNREHEIIWRGSPDEQPGLTGKIRRIFRNSRTGRFTTKEYVKKHPGTTETQTVHRRPTPPPDAPDASGR